MELQFYFLTVAILNIPLPFTNPSAVGYPAVLADVVLLFLNQLRHLFLTFLVETRRG